MKVKMVSLFQFNFLTKSGDNNAKISWVLCNGLSRKDDFLITIIDYLFSYVTT